MAYLTRFSLLVILAGSSTSAAWAQSYPSDLVAAYRAGVAAAKCDLALSPAKSSQLSEALQRTEQRSGLGQNDLDALWAKTQDEAAADSASFCAEEGPTVDGVIASNH